jgi:hypothetical protein
MAQVSALPWLEAQSFLLNKFADGALYSLHIVCLDLYPSQHLLMVAGYETTSGKLLAFHWV